MTRLPKLFLGVAVLLIVMGILDMPIEIFLAFAVMAIAFFVDVLFFQYERHREVLMWFLEHVHIVDKPLEESDAPESVKKLMRRGGDNGNG